VFSVDASSGTPLFTDGPYIETKEHLGGFAVVDVADEEAARLWAGKIARCDVSGLHPPACLPPRPPEGRVADRDLSALRRVRFHDCQARRELT
jgi:YCII-related domain